MSDVLIGQVKLDIGQLAPQVQKAMGMVDSLASGMNKALSSVSGQNEKMKQLGFQLDRLSNQYKLTGDKVQYKKDKMSVLDSALKATKGNLDKVASALKKSEQAYGKDSEQANKLRTSVEQLKTTESRLKVELGKTTDELEDQGDAAGETGGKIDNLAASMAGILSGAALGAVAAFGKKIVDTTMNFQQGMTLAASTMGTTRDEVDQLALSVRKLASTSVFSASQSADALYAIASAGYKGNTAIDMLAGTMALAAGTQTDLKQTAEALTGSLEMFEREARGVSAALGKEGVAGAAEYFADVTQAAIANTALNMQRFADGIKYIGPLANDLGWTFEDTAASLGLLNTAGIRGEQAGTGLRRVINAILDPTAEWGARIKDLRLNFYDLQGNLKPIPALIDELGKANLSAAEKAEYFGQEAGPTLAVLLAKGGDAVRDLADHFHDVAQAALSIRKPTSEAIEVFDKLGIKTKDNLGMWKGIPDVLQEMGEASATTADYIAIFGETLGPEMAEAVAEGEEAISRYIGSQETAGEQAKTLMGILNLLTSAVEEAFISMGYEGGIVEALSKIINKVTALVTWFNNLNPTVRGAVGGFVGVASAIAAVGAPASILIGQLPSIIAGFNTIKSLGMVQKFTGIAGSVNKLGGSVTGLGGVLGGLTKILGIVGAAFAGWHIGKMIANIDIDGKTLAQVVADFMYKIWIFFLDTWNTIINFWGDALGKLIAMVQNGLQSASLPFRAFAEAVGAAIRNILNIFKNAGSGIVNFAKMVGQALSGNFQAAAESWNAVKASFSNIGSVLKNAGAEIGGAWEKARAQIKPIDAKNVFANWQVETQYMKKALADTATSIVTTKKATDEASESGREMADVDKAIQAELKKMQAAMDGTTDSQEKRSAADKKALAELGKLQVQYQDLRKEVVELDMQYGEDQGNAEYIAKKQQLLAQLESNVNAQKAYEAQLGQTQKATEKVAGATEKATGAAKKEVTELEVLEAQYTSLTAQLKDLDDQYKSNQKSTEYLAQKKELLLQAIANLSLQNEQLQAKMNSVNQSTKEGQKEFAELSTKSVQITGNIRELTDQLKEMGVTLKETTISVTDQFKQVRDSITASLQDIGREIEILDLKYQGEGDSIEYLAQKQKLLQDKYEAQKKLLNEVTYQYNQLAKHGDQYGEEVEELSKQHSDLSMEVLKTEADMKKLGTTMDKVHEEVADAIRKLTATEEEMREYNLQEQIEEWKERGAVADELAKYEVAVRNKWREEDLKKEQEQADKIAKLEKDRAEKIQGIIEELETDITRLTGDEEAERQAIRESALKHLEKILEESNASIGEALVARVLLFKKLALEGAKAEEDRYKKVQDIIRNLEKGITELTLTEEGKRNLARLEALQSLEEELDKAKASDIEREKAISLLKEQFAEEDKQRTEKSAQELEDIQYDLQKRLLKIRGDDKALRKLEKEEEEKALKESLKGRGLDWKDYYNFVKQLREIQDAEDEDKEEERAEKAKERERNLIKELAQIRGDDEKVRQMERDDELRDLEGQLEEEIITKIEFNKQKTLLEELWAEEDKKLAQDVADSKASIEEDLNDRIAELTMDEAQIRQKARDDELAKYQALLDDEKISEDDFKTYKEQLEQIWALEDQKLRDDEAKRTDDMLSNMSSSRESYWDEEIDRAERASRAWIEIQKKAADEIELIGKTLTKRQELERQKQAEIDAAVREMLAEGLDPIKDREKFAERGRQIKEKYDKLAIQAEKERLEEVAELNRDHQKTMARLMDDETTLMEIEYEERLEELQDLLKRGILTQENYNQQVENLEEEFAERRRQRDEEETRRREEEAEERRKAEEEETRRREEEAEKRTKEEQEEADRVEKIWRDLMDEKIKIEGDAEKIAQRERERLITEYQEMLEKNVSDVEERERMLAQFIANLDAAELKRKEELLEKEEQAEEETAEEITDIRKDYREKDLKAEEESYQKRIDMMQTLKDRIAELTLSPEELKAEGRIEEAKTFIEKYIGSMEDASVAQKMREAQKIMETFRELWGLEDQKIADTRQATLDEMERELRNFGKSEIELREDNLQIKLKLLEKEGWNTDELAEYEYLVREKWRKEDLKAEEDQAEEEKKLRKEQARAELEIMEKARQEDLQRELESNQKRYDIMKSLQDRLAELTLTPKELIEKKRLDEAKQSIEEYLGTMEEATFAEKFKKAQEIMEQFYEFWREEDKQTNEEVADQRRDTLDEMARDVENFGKSEIELREDNLQIKLKLLEKEGWNTDQLAEYEYLVREKWRKEDAEAAKENRESELEADKKAIEERLELEKRASQSRINVMKSVTDQIAQLTLTEGELLARTRQETLMGVVDALVEAGVKDLEFFKQLGEAYKELWDIQDQKTQEEKTRTASENRIKILEIELNRLDEVYDTTEKRTEEYWVAREKILRQIQEGVGKQIKDLEKQMEESGDETDELGVKLEELKDKYTDLGGQIIETIVIRSDETKQLEGLQELYSHYQDTIKDIDTEIGKLGDSEEDLSKKKELLKKKQDILNKAIEVLKQVITEARDKMLKFGDASGITEKDVKTLEEEIERLGGELEETGDGITDVDQKLRKLPKDPFKAILEGLKATGKAFYDFGKGIATLIGKVGTNIKGQAGEILNDAEDKLNSLFSLVEGVGKIAVGDYLGGFTSIVDNMFKFDKVMEILQPIFDSLANAVKPLIPIIEKLFMILAQALAPVFEVLVEIVEALVPVLDVLINALKPVILVLGKLLATIGKALIPLLDIMAIAIDAITPIINNAAVILEALIPIVEAVGEALKSLTPIIKVLAGVIKTVAGAIGGITKIGSSIIGGIGKFISGIFKGIGRLFGIREGRERQETTPEGRPIIKISPEQAGEEISLLQKIIEGDKDSINTLKEMLDKIGDAKVTNSILGVMKESLTDALEDGNITWREAVDLYKETKQILDDSKLSDEEREKLLGEINKGIIDASKKEIDNIKQLYEAGILSDKETQKYLNEVAEELIKNGNLTSDQLGEISSSILSLAENIAGDTYEKMMRQFDKMVENENKYLDTAQEQYNELKRIYETNRETLTDRQREDLEGRLDKLREELGIKFDESILSDEEELGKLHDLEQEFQTAAKIYYDIQNMLAAQQLAELMKMNQEKLSPEEASLLQQFIDHQITSEEFLKSIKELNEKAIEQEKRQMERLDPSEQTDRIREILKVGGEELRNAVDKALAKDEKNLSKILEGNATWYEIRDLLIFAGNEINRLNISDEKRASLLEDVRWEIREAAQKEIDRATELHRKGLISDEKLQSIINGVKESLNYISELEWANIETMNEIINEQREAITGALERMGLTQEQIQKLTDEQIGWLKGVRDLNSEQIKKLADQLGISKNELMQLKNEYTKLFDLERANKDIKTSIDTQTGEITRSIFDLEETFRRGFVALGVSIKSAVASPGGDGVEGGNGDEEYGAQGGEPGQATPLRDEQVRTFGAAWADQMFKYLAIGVNDALREISANTQIAMQNLPKIASMQTSSTYDNRINIDRIIVNADSKTRADEIGITIKRKIEDIGKSKGSLQDEYHTGVRGRV